jgi:hypothetical protein
MKEWSTNLTSGEFMNPIQQVGTGNVQGFFSVWALSEILSGLIYRRTFDLKAEAMKTGVTNDFNLVIPEQEMHYYAQNAVLGANCLEQAYFSAGVGQGGTTQQRRTA